MNGLDAVRRQSVSEAVFEQLRDRILDGGFAAGAALPAERALCEALGVNRSAVREAIKRLEQARLVAVRHGGSSRVLAFRETAGLDLLPELLQSTDGAFDGDTVRAVIEMRSALAPDIARKAAAGADDGLCERLDAIVRAMATDGAQLERLQDLAARLWSLLVDASNNVAYRLAYNSLSEAYDRTRTLLAEPLRDELTSRTLYAELAGAVRARDGERAATAAASLVARGEAGIRRALDASGERQEARA